MRTLAKNTWSSAAHNSPHPTGLSAHKQSAWDTQGTRRRHTPAMEERKMCHVGRHSDWHDGTVLPQQYILYVGSCSGSGGRQENSQIRSTSADLCFCSNCRGNHGSHQQRRTWNPWRPGKAHYTSHIRESAFLFQRLSGATLVSLAGCLHSIPNTYDE